MITWPVITQCYFCYRVKYSDHQSPCSALLFLILIGVLEAGNSWCVWLLYSVSNAKFFFPKEKQLYLSCTITSKPLKMLSMCQMIWKAAILKWDPWINECGCSTIMIYKERLGKKNILYYCYFQIYAFVCHNSSHTVIIYILMRVFLIPSHPQYRIFVLPYK